MEIQSGLRVKVYFNLRKKCFSIQYKGRVIGYSDKLYLENVEFKVNEVGRQRVIKSGRKNVHAFVVGDYTLPYNADSYYDYAVRYNPYYSGDFNIKLTNIISKPIKRAKSALLFVSTMMSQKSGKVEVNPYEQDFQ